MSASLPTGTGRSGKAQGTVITSLLVILLTWLVGVVVHGYVAMQLWAWFVMPVFGLPALGLWSAAGLILAFRLASRSTIGRSGGETLGDVVQALVLWPLLALGSGWIVWRLALLAAG